MKLSIKTKIKNIEFSFEHIFYTPKVPSKGQFLKIKTPYFKLPTSSIKKALLDFLISIDLNVYKLNRLLLYHEVFALRNLLELKRVHTLLLTFQHFQQQQWLK